MKKTSSQKIQDVTILLQQGYSCRQVQSMTGISKTTVSRINKTYAEDKENNKEGMPSKLSAADQRRIMSWITGNWQPLSAHPPHPPNSSWNYPGYTSISKPIVNL